MAGFDYEEAGCSLDTSTGRAMYFFYDPEQYVKYIRPVRKGWGHKARARLHCTKKI